MQKVVHDMKLELSIRSFFILLDVHTASTSQLLFDVKLKTLGLMLVIIDSDVEEKRKTILKSE